MSRLRTWKVALYLLCLTTPSLIGCSKKEVPQQRAAASPANSQKVVAVPAPFGFHTDDLDQMLKRRNIRALMMVNPIDFFYSNGNPMGMVYEEMREFESFINHKMKTRALKVEVTFIPVRPDKVEAALTQVPGDLVAAGMVITPERQKQMAFTVPLRTNVKQVLVTGPTFGAASSLEDLGGKEVYVNPLSGELSESSVGERKIAESRDGDSL